MLKRLLIGTTVMAVASADLDRNKDWTTKENQKIYKLVFKEGCGDKLFKQQWRVLGKGNGYTEYLYKITSTWEEGYGVETGLYTDDVDWLYAAEDPRMEEYDAY